ncbi:MAG: dTMP kinase [Candidatus Schekmanbacteria bacterium RBG_13_48_7]|uniref:Thymidylate kinase n=1 Tax=Candidatus Schekmanbacteria bacterium RBG_13_48_7 TaxID=1817878 RepID=A0A1F7S3H5_9BACT|nr:MAG: dTMP kinase [Candidatus Schekmanbacteria bacterium RBG_13_48_7]
MTKTEKKQYPGLLFVFEGIDGSGKTTLTKKIHENLIQQKVDTILVSEPTNGYYGKLIRENAKKGFRFPPEKERDLFVKDRMENVSRTIIPALKKGQIVLMDRYYISSMAYQGARGLNPEIIQSENEKFAPVPDILFILDIPVEVGLKRIFEKRKDQFDDFEKCDYLQKVRSLFLSFSFNNMHVLDAQQSQNSLEHSVMNKILQKLQKYNPHQSIQ